MNCSKYLTPACFIFIVTAFTACQKVINVNLKNAPSQYVIEGNVTDLAGPYTLTITKSVPFDQENVYPTVSGAVVVITDNTANVTDTLKEASPGNYTSTVLAGVPGHKYSLYVNAAASVFTAACTMPAAVTMDSLYAQVSAFRSSSYQIVPVYNDPIAAGNNYHFVQIKNDTVISSISLRNDELINGQKIAQPINGGGGDKSGDRVTVYLECIDPAIYQYYYGLQQSENQNSASPANPISNISGGCLGYFSAHTMSSRSIVIP